jgi:hypothetical protein
VRKATMFFPVKSTKIILEKIIQKRKHKKNHIGKHYSNPEYFKNNHKTKFSTSSILKK